MLTISDLLKEGLTMRIAFCRIVKSVRISLGFGMIMAAFSAPAWAVHVPEIDPGSMASALTLLTGGWLMLAERRRRRS
jgi:hypothetical protein